MLFLRSLWKSKYYFLAATAILVVTTQLWEEQRILTEPGVNNFFQSCELLVPFLVLLPVSFLLYDNYEIELGLINGVSTLKLALCKFFSTVVATLVPLVACCLLVREKYYWCNPLNVRIPLEVPEHFRLYLALSAVVTTLFFASLFLLLRVVLRNCYAPVGLGILAFSLFQPRMQDVCDLSLPFSQALFDPFVTRYLIDDAVANAGFTVEATGQVVDPFPHLWTYNRLLFFGLAVVLLAVTCILLRRENLHESFGD